MLLFSFYQLIFGTMSSRIACTCKVQFLSARGGGTTECMVKTLGGGSVTESHFSVRPFSICDSTK